MAKNMPAMQETQVQSLGVEDTLEKEMATHSSVLTWRVPWTEECGVLQSMGSQRVGHEWVTCTFSFQGICPVVRSYHMFFIHSPIWGVLIALLLAFLPPWALRYTCLCLQLILSTFIKGWMDHHHFLNTLVLGTREPHGHNTFCLDFCDVQVSYRCHKTRRTTVFLVLHVEADT